MNPVSLLPHILYKENHEIENITMTVLNTKVYKAHFGAVMSQYPNLFMRILVQKIIYNI